MKHLTSIVKMLANKQFIRGNSFLFGEVLDVVKSYPG